MLPCTYSNINLLCSYCYVLNSLWQQVVEFDFPLPWKSWASKIRSYLSFYFGILRQIMNTTLMDVLVNFCDIFSQALDRNIYYCTMNDSGTRPQKKTKQHLYVLINMTRTCIIITYVFTKTWHSYVSIIITCDKHLYVDVNKTWFFLFRSVLSIFM